MTAPYHEDMMEWPPLLQNLLIQGQVWFWSVLFVVDMRALALMIFGGTIYGAIWTVNISGQIAIERDSGTYDLLCLSPAGTIGTTWAICTGCIHRDEAFRHINSQESWSVRFILLVPLVISTHLVFRQLFGEAGDMTLLWILALIALFYIDHVQSILMASLLGALASYYAPGRLDARLWALAGFMAVQLATYTFPVIMGIIVLPGLYQRLNIHGWSAGLSLPIFSVLIFYSAREYILCRLWRALSEQLNAAPAEFDFMFRQVA